MRNPPVIGELSTIQITYIATTKVYGKLRRLKNTIGLLRFRSEGEEKNRKYNTKLLQVLCTLYLKLPQNENIHEMKV